MQIQVQTARCPELSARQKRERMEKGQKSTRSPPQVPICSSDDDKGSDNSENKTMSKIGEGKDWAKKRLGWLSLLS
jgi:hypothetical protein